MEYVFVKYLRQFGVVVLFHLYCVKTLLCLSGSGGGPDCLYMAGSLLLFVFGMFFRLGRFSLGSVMLGRGSRVFCFSLFFLFPVALPFRFYSEILLWSRQLKFKLGVWFFPYLEWDVEIFMHGNLHQRHSCREDAEPACRLE